MSITDVIEAINAFAWVAGNVLVAYIAALLILFVILYPVFFNTGATDGGKLILRFMISLVGVVLLVFVGIFIDPSSGREWLTYPGDVAIWRPVVRFGIWAYVSWTITALVILLGRRKFRPHLVNKAGDETLVKLRDKK